MEPVTPFEIGQYKDSVSPLARTPHVALITLAEALAELAIVTQVPVDSFMSALTGVLQRELYRQALGKPSLRTTGDKQVIEEKLAEVSVLVKDFAYVVDAHLVGIERQYVDTLKTKTPSR